MPLLKKTEPIPPRPVIIVLYGPPGVGKTSLFNTSEEPLLLDFDRGTDRAILRPDTVIVNRWEDIDAEEKSGLFKKYKTIGIDTAKSALDDFLLSYVIKKDAKCQKNKLAAYGAIGDEFKLFINNRRQDMADLVIIAHAKEEKDGDLTKSFPDVTGGSYNLLLRIADQVGFISTVNNLRSIQFEPTDRTIGKNVARIPLINIPDESDPAFKTFMGSLISKVRNSICAASEAQLEAIAKAERIQKDIAEIETADDLTLIIPVVQELPKAQKDALLKLIGDKAKEKKFIWDKAAGKFNDPPPAEDKKLNGKAKEPVKEELPFA